MNIEFSSALCLAQMEPVSSFVAGTLKALNFDEGFEENRTVTVEGAPVVG